MIAGSASAQQIIPNALLTIDQNRATVVDRVVNQWGDRLAASNAGITSAQLREILGGLRADHLLAASLAGSIDGLRDVVSGALVHTAAAISPGLMQTKALGDANDDLVYTPIVPCRILDTRHGTIPPYNAQMVGGSGFPVASNLANFAPKRGSRRNCKLPLASSALFVVLTGLNPYYDAFLASVNSCNFATLTRSLVMDFSANKGVTNTAIVPVDGSVRFYLGLPAQVTTNVIADAVGYFKAPGGQYFMQGGNSFGATAVLGTNDLNAVEIDVAGMRALRLEPVTLPVPPEYQASVNIVGGHPSNILTGLQYGATIAGGGGAGSNCGIAGASQCYNSVRAFFGTVSGGLGNMAGGFPFPPPSGGYATVGGGVANIAGQTWTTVSGGNSNTASGAAATIPGGFLNTASGDFSFAAGRRATTQTSGVSATVHNGTFVWADSNDFDFNSTTGNEFSARATGGVRFVLGIDGLGAPTWTCAASNGNSWACSSDRNLKENFERVNGETVLQRLAELPLYFWTAKGTDPSVRHLGPTAQDFMAAFALGNNDKMIGMQDSEGVALAAIQGLNQMIQQKDREIMKLRERLQAIEVKLGL
jgi:hypothetical protein